MPREQPPEDADLYSNHKLSSGFALIATGNHGFGEDFCAKDQFAQKPLVLNIYLCKAQPQNKKLHSPNGLWVA